MTERRQRAPCPTTLPPLRHSEPATCSTGISDTLNRRVDYKCKNCKAEITDRAPAPQLHTRYSISSTVDTLHPSQAKQRRPTCRRKLASPKSAITSTRPPPWLPPPQSSYTGKSRLTASTVGQKLTSRPYRLEDSRAQRVVWLLQEVNPQSFLLSSHSTRYNVHPLRAARLELRSQALQARPQDAPWTEGALRCSPARKSRSFSFPLYDREQISVRRARS